MALSKILDDREFKPNVPVVEPCMKGSSDCMYLQSDGSCSAEWCIYEELPKMENNSRELTCSVCGENKKIFSAYSGKRSFICDECLGKIKLITPDDRLCEVCKKNKISGDNHICPTCQKDLVEAIDNIQTIKNNSGSIKDINTDITDINNNIKTNSNSIKDINNDISSINQSIKDINQSIEEIRGKLNE